MAGPTRLELATSGVTGRGRFVTVRARIPYEPKNEGFRAIPKNQTLVVLSQFVPVAGRKQEASCYSLPVRGVLLLFCSCEEPRSTTRPSLLPIYQTPCAELSTQVTRSAKVD